MQLDELKWDRDGLVTVVVQDALTGDIRMVAHADAAAVRATLDSGFATFYSRSRQQLWRKGETSGHTLRVSEVWSDCDADALIYLARPDGPSCHTDRETCFFQRAGGDGEFHEEPTRHAQSALPHLWSELDARRSASEERSYTKHLLASGTAKIGAKLEEEANELARALQSESEPRVASEAADVMYHLLVGLLARGVTLRDVEAELAQRFGTSGLDEKSSRR
ncbi:MAG TPA: bifunctional phosphoribosyl-AMP cyclohydrolase/phosphoribosyl-ATP diphosphatase HisIE [Polyangiales bacterium]